MVRTEPLNPALIRHEPDLPSKLATLQEILIAVSDRIGMNGGITRIIDDDFYIINVIDNPMIVAGDMFHLQETFCRLTVDVEQTLVIENAALSPYYDDQAVRRFGIQAYIGTPILRSGKLFGTLFLDSQIPRTQPFSLEEIAYLEAASLRIQALLEA